MYFSITTGRRNNWTVKVPVSKLLKCCEERLGYHAGRVLFWGTELAKAEKALREGGIKIKEYEVTGGSRMETTLDPGLARRMEECQKRRQANSDAIDRFRAYHAFFKVAGDTEMDLNADDVLYFNLEGADVLGERINE